MNKFFIVLILLSNIELFSQNNSELFEMKLNISNIESSRNLMIAIWSDSNSWNTNTTNSSVKWLVLTMVLKKRFKKVSFLL